MASKIERSRRSYHSVKLTGKDLEAFAAFQSSCDLEDIQCGAPKAGEAPSLNKRSQFRFANLKSLFKSKKVNPIVPDVSDDTSSSMKAWNGQQTKKADQSKYSNRGSLDGRATISSCSSIRSTQKRSGTLHSMIQRVKKLSEAEKSIRNDNLNFPLASVRQIHVGEDLTLSQRILFRIHGWQDISPWHNIPLFESAGALHFVCTTPKNHWGKYEIAKEEPQNPLRLKKNGSNYPSHYVEDLPMNYGFLPQTSFHKDVLSSGSSPPRLLDNKNPVFAFDLSSSHARRSGDVYTVKPLAGFLVGDSAKGFSWHIITIDRDDPKAGLVDDLRDIDVVFPGAMDKIKLWLKTHNIESKDDKQALIGNNGKAADLKTVMRVIELSHDSWMLLDEEEKATRTPLSTFKPLSMDELEMMWHQQTANERPDAILARKPR